MRSIRRIVLGSLLVCLGAPAALPASAAPEPRIFFVARHAEKGTGENPSLTPEGRARAEALARMLHDARISRIYVSEFKRTQETAAPLAQALGVTAQAVSGDVTPRLKSLSAGRRALVVSHSDVVPEIVTKLGCAAVEPFGETEFDRLYVISLASDGTCALARLHYGAPNP